MPIYTCLNYQTFFSSELITGKGEMSLSLGHGFLVILADVASKLLQSQSYMTFSITEIILLPIGDPRSPKIERSSLQ